MITTGIFGGSFNPIHNGHTALAYELCKRGEVDELWLLVSPQNPLKRQDDLLPEMLRLKMARLAVKDIPSVSVSDFEFSLPRPSYMVHTLEKLRETYPQREFVLIIGADNWINFKRWYKSEEILKRHSIIIYPRNGFNVSSSSLPSGVKIVDTPLYEISSTEIRELIHQNKSIQSLVNPKVADILKSL